MREHLTRREIEPVFGSAGTSRSVHVSPDHLQRKLNLARRRLGGGDQSRAGDGISSLVEDREVSGRRGKISPIQDVEKFGSELDIDVFRKSVDVVVLKNRSIQFRSPWSDQRIASEVASKVCRIRKSEALSFDVVIRISRVGQRVAAWAHKAVRRLAGLIQLHA